MFIPNLILGLRLTRTWVYTSHPIGGSSEKSIVTKLEATLLSRDKDFFEEL